jgi:drug/metabolite transporter (DMT)-like permease
MKINPKLVVILAALFCAFSAVFVRFSTAPSVTMAAYRMGLSALILLPVVLKVHLKELKSIDKKTLGLCLINGVFLALHFATYFESLKHTSVASAVVLVDTQVIFVALIMWLVMKQAIPVKGIIGIVLTLTGSIIIALVIGLVIGFITVSSMKGKMTSVRFNNSARQYAVNNSFNLNTERDIFLFRTVTFIRRPKNNSNGSHRSASGGSYRSRSGSF